MKKILLVLIFCGAISCAESFSQDIGIKGGGNIAMLHNASSTDAVLYFHTGIYLRESLEGRHYRRANRSRFFFQPELTYSRQGASLPDHDLWFKNDYVNLGLIFQYRPVYPLGIDIGPQAGYMVISDATDKWVGKKEKIGTSHYFKKMDYSLCFGLTYHTGFFMDFAFRYNLGLTDVVRNNSGKSVRNGVFQLSMQIDLW